MRTSLKLAVILPLLIVAVEASASDFWTVRSFRTRAEAEIFAAFGLPPGTYRDSAIVVQMKSIAGRDVHVIHLADSRFEDPNVELPVTVQRCATLDGVYSCAGTFVWMAAAGRSAMLIAVPSGDSMVLFDAIEHGGFTPRSRITR